MQQVLNYWFMLYTKRPEICCLWSKERAHLKINPINLTKSQILFTFLFLHPSIYDYRIWFCGSFMF